MNAPQRQPAEGMWLRYKDILVDPFAPALRFVAPASSCRAAPELRSLDLIDYGTRRCINATLTGLCVALSAPWVGGIGLPVQTARQVHGPKRWVLAPLAVPAGLAVGCVSGVANLTVRGMGAGLGAAAAVTGVACFPIDVAGCALAQWAATLDDDHE